MILENSPEVLLVEDREEDAILTIRSLKKYNLINEVTWLEDGQQAIDYLFGSDGTEAQAVPRLIMLDLKLPKINGLEVLERIKASEALKRVPVIVMTSSKEDIDVERAYALGVNSYIVKPIDFPGFAEAIRRLGFYWLMLNHPPKTN